MKMGIHGFKVTNSEEIRKQALAQLDEMEELAGTLQQSMVNFFSIVFAYHSEMDVADVESRMQKFVEETIGAIQEDMQAALSVVAENYSTLRAANVDANKLSEDLQAAADTCRKDQGEEHAE